MKDKIYKLTCERCNGTWMSTITNPKQCPKCHSSLWNNPKIILSCQQCDHKWSAHSGNPQNCPKCNSRLWKGYTPKNRKYAVHQIEEITKAYLAGILDGEGCIFITKRLKNNTGNYHFDLHVHTGNTNMEVLELIEHYYGGSIQIDKDKRRGKDYKFYRSCLAATNAMYFLEDILPYLIIKKNRATLAIQFQQEKASNYRKKRTPKMDEYRNSCRDSIMAMNQRVPHKY